MADSFGLTDQGLTIPTIADIRADITARILKTISPTLDLSDRSLEGQIVGIVAEAIARAWEQLEVIFTAWDPDKAVGVFLEALSALTGTTPPLPSKSAVVLTLTGTPAAVVPSGDQAGISDGQGGYVSLWATSELATIAALSAWLTSAAYGLGTRVTHAGNVYQCTLAGTSGATGPIGADLTSDETDGTVHWRYLGEGTGAIDVPAACTVVGPTTANAATITAITTPEGGWSGVVNVLDASVGRNAATSAQLRALRELELFQPGSSPVDAIRAELLDVVGVTAVTVFENVQEVTSDDGIPPHSVEAMVQGGDDQAIFDALLASVAGGIRTWGQGSGEVDGSATDSQGTAHPMKFTRPGEVPVYVTITLTKDASRYPSDGDQQVKDAITAWGDLRPAGYDAVSNAILAQAFTVLGVLDVTACSIGTAPAPATSTTIAIGLRQLATYDTSRIVVNSSTAGVP